MRDLQGYRNYVYGYLDLEVDDLDTTLIDAWVAEGFRKITQTIKRWRFYEVVETMATEPSRRNYPLPGLMVDVRAIEAPWGVLDYIDYSEARDRFHLYSGTVSTGTARAFSVWGGELHIWPLPTAAETLTVVGYRGPADWMAGGAGATPDFPESFEDALLSWVMYRAFRHQDEDERAEAERRDFEERLTEATTHDMQTPSAAPLVMGSGGVKVSKLPPRLAYPWE